MKTEIAMILLIVAFGALMLPAAPAVTAVPINPPIVIVDDKLTLKITSMIITGTKTATFYGTVMSAYPATLRATKGIATIVSPAGVQLGTLTLSTPISVPSNKAIAFTAYLQAIKPFNSYPTVTNVKLNLSVTLTVCFFFCINLGTYPGTAQMNITPLPFRF